jgi:SCY1-like protein 1
MGNSASSLPYSIGKQVCLLEHGWALHEGQQKADGATVSVFVAKKPQLAKTPVDRRSAAAHLTQLRPALHHFLYSRKLRHPHILTVHATLDTDNPGESSGASGAEYKKNAAPNTTASQSGDLIIVTEACLPLDVWLQQQQQQPPEVLAWGLEGACRALHFLHASANLAHGNVGPQSLMVTRAGDVKLGNFSLTTTVGAANGGLHPDFMDYEALLTPLQYRSPERVSQAWDSLVSANNTTHAMDSYAMAVLISHVYGGHIPGPLVKATQRLQTPNVKMRPRLQPLLKCPVFDTPYQKIQLQLEEFAVQPVEAKIGFWNNLTPSLKAGLYPSALAQYKIFPILKTSLVTICSSDATRTQDLYRREGAFPFYVFVFYTCTRSTCRTTALW